MRPALATLLVLLFAPGVPSARAQEDTCSAGRIEADRLLGERRYAAAARAYHALVRAQCPALDEALYNMAIAYEADRLHGRAIRVRLTLVERFADSPLAGRALYFVAANYHALAVYAEAARYYARFAELHPGEIGEHCAPEARATGTCPDAKQALENAIFFQLALGDREAAEASVALYERSFAARFPEDTASVVSSMGRGIEGDPEASAAHAEAFLARYGATARLEQRARAWLDLARARIAQGRRADADAALARVIALVTPEAIAALTGSQEQVWLWGARARDALAEALFLSADRALPSIPAPPRYAGPRTEAGIRAWAAGALTAWRDRQVRSIAPRIEALAPAAEHEIPTWMIAAQEREGDLHAAVLRAGLSAEPPSWAETDEPLLVAFEEARATALAPVSAAALAAYGACSRTAQRLRWYSERSQRCEAALFELDPEHHGRHDELHGAPDREGDRLARPEPREPREDDAAADE